MTAFGDTTFIEERTVFRQVAASKQLSFNSTPMPASMSESDRRWEEVLASTTPEQWERLERMFRDDEAEGTTPLDFTGR